MDEADKIFLKGERNSDLRKTLEDDFNKIISESKAPGTEMNYLLDKIHHEIRKKEVIENQKPLPRLLRVYMRVAAVLLIPIMIALTVTNRGWISGSGESVSSTIIAPLGSRISFTLPDGTNGMLNSGSSITYSLPFKNDRNLILSGEGWFDVTRDDKHPFIINALNSSITVIGTTFNLSAYPDEKSIEVVVGTGKVEFKSNNSDQKHLILPTEKLVLRNDHISKSVIDTSKYKAWTEGKLVFRGDPMSEVARKIARWYNVEIELADKQLESYSFYGTFDDDSVEDILSFLAMTSPTITYEILPGAILPDGTHMKEKIIIRLLDNKLN